jgi:integrase
VTAQALAHFRPTFARRRGLIRDMSKLGNVKARKTPAGEARWYILIAGHKIYRGRDNVGEWDFESEAEAQRYLDRIRARLEDGMELDKLLDQILPKPRRSIVQMSEKWLAAKWSQAQAGRITVRSYRVFEGAVKNHWPYWRDTPVEGLSRGQLDDWATYLAVEKKLAPATVSYVLATLHSFYQWLRDREEITHLPSFPTVSVPEYTPQWLTREEQTRVLDAIPDAVRGIFLAMADCAMRPNEARCLRPSDLNAEGWVTIERAVKDRGSKAPIGPTKTGRTRTVPLLTDRLLVWLKAHPPQGTLLFFSPAGAMWSHKEMATVWDAACADAKVRRVPMREGTRHSTATWLRTAGHSPFDVQRLLGHANVSMTERYAKARPAELVRLREVK